MLVFLHFPHQPTFVALAGAAGAARKVICLSFHVGAAARKGERAGEYRVPSFTVYVVNYL